ncbi:inositol monophosphatase family protein [Streptacidiphilus cavernicola]|uniref:Inositol monophosphatase n=1 Tax=Streptacidiphilus cavernicola TaxID=3342716 RepID=A0ABV6W2B3_9ACTN
METVTEILREAAATAILPRFQSLADGDVSEKSPGEVVTIADREAEALITRRLRTVLDAPVVGEEATADNPALLTALREAPSVWLVDPLDGTANFIAGRPTYAVMAALVRHGETVAAWIVHPATGLSYQAERGSGAWRDGVRIQRAPASADPAELRGAAFTRFLPPSTRAYVEAARAQFADAGLGTKAAGVDYPQLAEGLIDFSLYQRTLPWDHAPGALLLTEAGGTAARPDATLYRPDDPGLGLLAAADPQSWHTVRDTLLPPP